MASQNEHVTAGDVMGGIFANVSGKLGALVSLGFFSAQWIVAHLSEIGQAGSLIVGAIIGCLTIYNGLLTAKIKRAELRKILSENERDAL